MLLCYLSILNSNIWNDSCPLFWWHVTSFMLFYVYNKVWWNYYKLRQLTLLQSAMDSYYKLQQLFYYKVRHGLLQIATGQYKMRWIYYKLRKVLQSAMIITNCDSTWSRFLQHYRDFPQQLNHSLACVPHSRVFLREGERLHTGYYSPNMLTNLLIKELCHEIYQNSNRRNCH